MPTPNDATTGFQLSALPQPYSLPSNVGKVDVGELQQAYANSLKNAQATALVGPQTQAAISQAKYEQGKNQMLQNLLPSDEQALLASYRNQKASQTNAALQAEGGQGLQYGIGMDEATAAKIRAQNAANNPYGVGMGTNTINNVQLPFIVGQGGQVTPLYNSGVASKILTAPTGGTIKQPIGGTYTDSAGNVLQNYQYGSMTPLGPKWEANVIKPLRLGNDDNVPVYNQAAQQSAQQSGQQVSQGGGMTLAPSQMPLGNAQAPQAQATPSVPALGSYANAFPQTQSIGANALTALPAQPSAPAASPTAPAAPAPTTGNVTAPSNVSAASQVGAQDQAAQTPTQKVINVPNIGTLPDTSPAAQAYQGLQKIAPDYAGVMYADKSQASKDRATLQQQVNANLEGASNQVMALKHLSNAFSAMNNQAIPAGPLNKYLNAEDMALIGQIIGEPLDGNQQVSAAARGLVEKLGNNISNLRAYAGIKELVIGAKPSETDTLATQQDKLNYYADLMGRTQDKNLLLQQGLDMNLPANKIESVINKEFAVKPEDSYDKWTNRRANITNTQASRVPTPVSTAGKNTIDQMQGLSPELKQSYQTLIQRAKSGDAAAIKGLDELQVAY